MRRTLVVLGLLLAASFWSSGQAAFGQAPLHNCTFCHSLHGGPGQSSFGPLLPAEIIEDVCTTCHSEAGPDQVNRDGTLVDVPKGPYAVHNGGKHVKPTGCWDCHNHEGEAGLNLFMIQDDMPTPDTITGDPSDTTRAVVFTSRGTDAGQAAANSFADGDDTYNGVCEVCHTKTSNHGNGDKTSNHGHEAGRTCSTCHTHEGGFGGGGPCRDCHNSAQDNGDGLPTWRSGRREVLSEFSRSSHHIEWTDTIADVDCVACHDQSGHQEGIVRLWNVDQPGDTAAAIKLLGDPSSNATEAAKLEAFCLACHDSGGAGPSQPFTDGNTPPTVSASAWTAASHKDTGAYTCWDCHDTGHGSLKQKLLEPSNVAPNATTKYEEEEGFCFVCHDSDGPATFDAKLGFDTTPLWAGDGTQYGPVNQNDRHDVYHATQSTSNVKIECADCHDPHTANATSPPFSLVRADPDPTDGRVPGTGWFADSAAVVQGTTTGTTADDMTEWCLDCHDGSLPSGVLDNRSPQVYDILHATGGNSTGWYQNSHGAGPSGAALKTGTNYWGLDVVVSCLACHQAHPDNSPQQYSASLFNNLFMLNDTIYGVDFTTLIPADDAADYELTSLTTRRNDFVNGYYWCNTCHINSMGSGKQNCFDCHTHGDGRF